MDNKMIEYLLSVATYVDNYCKYLKKDTNDYASILGYLYRVHQDEIRNISPQGIGLLLMYLKDVDEKNYTKHIDAYKTKVDDIINNSKTIDEQFKKMDKIKLTIK